MTEEGSFLDRAANIINSNRRTVPDNPLEEFEPYLDSLPWKDIKAINNRNPKPKKTATLRPDLVIKCYQNVPKLYFSSAYHTNADMYTMSRKEAFDKTSRMQDNLDEVEVCLFNQISSRFDEILAVLRTIESLECVVDYNSQKLKQVRGSNMKLVKSVSDRQRKIAGLLRKQQRLKEVVATLAEIK